MRLDTEFIQLPFRFDAARLAEEVLAIDESSWVPHPSGFKGNSALILVATQGDHRNQDLRGQMLTTPPLELLPYVRQVMSFFRSPIARSRLMRLQGNCEATLHMDSNYYWHQRVRIHVPILTNDDVEFHCADKVINMRVGDCWIFDTWKMHKVVNPRDDLRIHLVIDTVGSHSFWDMVNRGYRRFDENSAPVTPQLIPFNPEQSAAVVTENINVPVVMTPWEQKDLLQPILMELIGKADLAPLLDIIEAFLQDWYALWTRFGTSRAGEQTYVTRLLGFNEALETYAGKFMLQNTQDAVDLIRAAVVRPALNFDLLAAGYTSVGGSSQGGSIPLGSQAVSGGFSSPASQALGAGAASPQDRFVKPVFIVAAPRSGSTFLFETLAKSPDFFTVGGESHKLIESIPALRPENRGWHSNRLEALDATESVAQMLRGNFINELRDRDGESPGDLQSVRFLEKTPKNALRIPFLKAIFPDAKFIYLVREPKENVSSIMAAWKSGGFVTYPGLPDWHLLKWSLLLTPGWQTLKGKALEEVAAAQWKSANEQVMADLQLLPASDWCLVNYTDLTNDTETEIRRLCRFADVRWDRPFDTPLPNSRYTLTAPRRDKWKEHEREILSIEPGVAPLFQEILAYRSFAGDSAH